MDEALVIAVQHHSSGKLDEALEAYQHILETNPDHPEALHLLGVLHHQIGKSGDGIELIRKALSLQPDYAEARNNLGNDLRETGR